MTCIVGLEHDGRVYIGGDGRASDGWGVHRVDDPKVFVLDDRFLIGFTHTFRLGQLLRYKLNVPMQSPSQSDDVYMRSIFVDAVRDLLKQYGHAKVDSSVESGGEFLVGYRGVLYHMQNDYSLVRFNGGYDACGSGEHWALGALYAIGSLEGESPVSPEKQIMLALQAAAQFCAFVSEPFTVLEL